MFLKHTITRCRHQQKITKKIIRRKTPLNEAATIVMTKESD